MRLLICISICVLVSACSDKPEACIEVNAQANLGEQVEIVNCSKSFESIEVVVPGFLNERTDLPTYLAKFDKAGVFEVTVLTENGKNSDEISAVIEVVEPDETDLEGIWRLYKREGVGEFAFREESNVYDYEPYEVRALDERLNIRQDLIYFEYNQNVDSYFIGDSLSWSYRNANASNNFRTTLNIGNRTFSIVGFHEGRMILYHENQDADFLIQRNLLYFEKRS